MRFLTLIALVATTFVKRGDAVSPTDFYRDGDLGQSGYLPNHNMDPNIVNSAAFGQLWKVAFNKNEQFYAKPLTYTPLAGGNQLLFLASSMNYVRTLDAKNGTIINQRQLHTPFLQSDIGCTDIPNYIGIIGTPTIDPTSDIVYLFSKTYIPNYRIPGNTGMENGVYYFHAININTLADVYPPVLLDGTYADNAPQKYFVGGVSMQRPSLTQIGTTVFGAFGSSCDLFNYTGLVIGMNINTGKMVTQFAMESGPLSPGSTTLRNNGGGGEAGIWMSGMGIASDGNRLFVVTGNGAAHQNIGPPVAGSTQLYTLGEAAVNLAVNSATGVLSLGDWFQPYDYQAMDGGDQDYGSGGIVLLDPTYFSGGGVSKLAITCGKNGKIYVLNANNLGGYKLGAGQTDNVVQTISANNAIFGAAGSYPGEGGYIYFCPDGYPMFAYGMNKDTNGLPSFAHIGQSNEISTGRVGVGIPTVTSLNGKPGTAILWLTDPGVGLRAWYAVPQNGVLVNIPLPQIGGANKFQRPSFGDGRVYTTDSNGVLYCLGSPVSLPLNCTAVDFGQVPLGTKVSQNITCTANIAITSVNGLEVASPFYASNGSLPTTGLTKGSSFHFAVTWDLTNVTDSIPGVKSAPLTLMTTNGVTGYANSFPVSLTGAEISQVPYLVLAPRTQDYGAIVVVNGTNPSTNSLSLTIANDGLSPMKILGYGYTNNPLSTSPTFKNSTLTNGEWDLGVGFTASNLPAVGSVIPAGTTISVSTLFDAVNGVGSYLSYWYVWSDGGNAYSILEGSASTAPIANFSISNGEGGWLPSSNLLMDFGDVAPGSTSSRQIQICNNGGSTLSIDKSKPPNGVFHISDPTELEETQLILPGACAYGTVLFVANTEEYDLPDLVLNNTWTLNTNDLNFGVHVVQITGTVISAKVGPTNSTGQQVYNYLGCFKESSTGPRLFPNEPLSPNANMTNANCQTACYGSAGYWFAGTEYGKECWCGNTPPPLANQDLTDTLCNFACTGDGSDRCGASGYASVYYNPTKYVAGTDPSLYGPQVPKTIGSYNYQGCFSEGTNGRALTALTPKAPATGFTLELCVAACKGYTYAGMEYSNQCYCGNSLAAGSVNQTLSTPALTGCSMACTGNSLEYCGGASRLSLYMLNSSVIVSTSSTSNIVTSTTTSKASTSTTISISSTGTISSSSTGTISTSKTLTQSSTTTSTTPVPTLGTVTNVPGWNYLGCYSEATTGRALSGSLLPIPAANTNVENCAAACSAFQYFGVEYGVECYCGNVINQGSQNQSSTVPSANGCNIVCGASPYEYCGGRSRLNMYQVLSSVSSSITSKSSSATSSSSLSVSTSSSLSVSSSSTSSSVTTTSTGLSTTSTSSSVKSTTLPASSSSSSSSPSLSSTITSSSSSSSTSLSSTTVSSSSSITLSNTSPIITSTSSTTSTSSASTPLWTGALTPGQQIGTQQYLGCSTEVSGRTLSGSSFTSGTAMTIEACQSFCASNNYALSGLEYASQCYCSNSLTTGSALGATGCNMACSANNGEICGGSSRLSVFNNTAYVYPSAPTNVGSYVFQGCYHEPATGRLLSGPNYSNSTGMTVESCVSFCKANGANGIYAGVEYAQECYCSSTLPATAVASTSCTTLCRGNNKEFCGGPSVLDVYMYQAPTKRRRNGWNSA